MGGGPVLTLPRARASLDRRARVQHVAREEHGGAALRPQHLVRVRVGSGLGFGFALGFGSGSGLGLGLG